MVITHVFAFATKVKPYWPGFLFGWVNAWETLFNQEPINESVHLSQWVREPIQE